MTAEQNERPDGRPAMVLAACLLVSALVYGSALGNGFFKDDFLFLNVAGRVLDDPGRLLTERPLGFFRPVYVAWLTVQRAAFGLEPAGYHAVGILLHGLVGFCVFLLARRLLPRPAAALSGLAFVMLFAHGEASLWIAAQNSSLVAGLCVLTVVLHLRACEKGGVRAALPAALAFAAAALAKESGLIVLAWLPLAEACAFGWRSLFRRPSLLRYALLAGLTAAILASNQTLVASLTGTDAASPGPVRITADHVTVERIFSTVLWSVSPLIHTEPSPRDAALGAGLLAALALVVAWRRRDLAPVTLLGTGLLLSGAVPACMKALQMPNSWRLYYFPTVGTALLLGTVFALLVPARPFPRGRGLVALALLALFVGTHVPALRALNETYYARISNAQTAIARGVGEHLGTGSRTGPVYLIDPYMAPVHAKEMLELFHDVDPARVQGVRLDRTEADAWLTPRLAADDGAVALDWHEGRVWADVSLEDRLYTTDRIGPARRLGRGWPVPLADDEVLDWIWVIRVTP